jgi:hypothetical protein
VLWPLAPLPATAFWFKRYLVVALRPLTAAPLAVRCRYLIVVPRPMPAATLVGRRRYLIVVPRPVPAAPHRYLIVVPGPLPAASRRSWCPGRCPRRRSFSVAGT